MVAGPYRVVKRRRATLSATEAPDPATIANEAGTQPPKKDQTTDAGDGYLASVMKLIPSEVIALFLFGDGIMETDETYVSTPVGQLVWCICCLVVLLVVRALNSQDTGNANKANDKGPQWRGVFTAAVSFVVWVYTLGGFFAAFHIHNPALASLILAVWTVVLPFVSDAVADDDGEDAGGDDDSSDAGGDDDGADAGGDDDGADAGGDDDGSDAGGDDDGADAGGDDNLPDPKPDERNLEYTDLEEGKDDSA